MTPQHEAGDDERMFRALSSGVRTRLLALLRAEPDLDAAGLAERLGLHVNTVRTHLGVLEEAGLVVSEEETRDRPGRPRRLYRASDVALPGAGDGGYRLLAEVLAGYLHVSAPEPAAAGEEAGRAWGAHAVSRPAPFTGGGADDALRRLTAMLDDLGFAPALDPEDGGRPRIVLGRCPFGDVARAHEDVVCAVHLGLMRGALAELGTDVEVVDLLPWVEPDRCVAHLQVAEV